MYRYVWQAFADDGSVVDRFSPDGKENSPDPWKTRQFHLFSFTGEKPIHLYIPKGAQFHFFKRRILDDSGTDSVIYIAGWSLEESANYVFCCPDGSMEISSSTQHITAYERQ